MKKKILRNLLSIPLILACAGLVVLAIAGIHSALTPKAPAPPPADTPAVQELSPESAETLAAATQALAGVQPPEAIGQANDASGQRVPYAEIPLLSTGQFFEQQVDDHGGKEHRLTVYGVNAFTLNKSGLLKVQIAWGLQTPDGFIYALHPDQPFTLKDARSDAELRLPRGRLFGISIAGSGCADFARLDWQACASTEPGYAALFKLGESYQRSRQRANLLLIGQIAAQSTLDGWISVGWPVVFPFVNDLIVLP